MILIGGLRPWLLWATSEQQISFRSYFLSITKERLVIHCMIRLRLFRYIWRLTICLGRARREVFQREYFRPHSCPTRRWETLHIPRMISEFWSSTRSIVNLKFFCALYTITEIVPILIWSLKIGNRPPSSSLKSQEKASLLLSSTSHWLEPLAKPSQRYPMLNFIVDGLTRVNGLKSNNPNKRFSFDYP